MISQIVVILYASRFIVALSSFIFSYQWQEMHTSGAILLLHLTPTCGSLFVTVQLWYSLWSKNLMIIQLNQHPSRNSLCATLHKNQRQGWKSTLTSSRDYLRRLNYGRKIWISPKLTWIPLTIWYVNSRKEAVESKHHQQKSKLSALFMLMVFYVGI